MIKITKTKYWFIIGLVAVLFSAITYTVVSNHHQYKDFLGQLKIETKQSSESAEKCMNILNDASMCMKMCELQARDYEYFQVKKACERKVIEISYLLENK